MCVLQQACSQTPELWPDSSAAEKSRSQGILCQLERRNALGALRPFAVSKRLSARTRRRHLVPRAGQYFIINSVTFSGRATQCGCRQPSSWGQQECSLHYRCDPLKTLIPCRPIISSSTHVIHKVSHYSVQQTNSHL